MSDDYEDGERDVEQCADCDRPVFANCDICGWPKCAMHGSIVGEFFMCTQCRGKAVADG